MEKIIGRVIEKAYLMEILSPDQELVAVYGRRVGKTFLIRNSFEK